MSMKDFNERLETATKAKQAMQARASAKAATNSVGYAERQAERVAAGIAREQRKAEAEVRKRAEVARLAEEKIAAAKAEAAAKELELNRALNDALALKAVQKAGRDAKYAARQERREARRA